MMCKMAYATLAIGVLVSPAGAGQLDALAQALELPRLMIALQKEGVTYGSDLASELFPGNDPAPWQRIVTEIHDPERIGARAREELGKAFVGHEGDVTQMLGYLTTDIGKRIIGLELSAREAYLDEATKEAALKAYEQMVATESPRLALIERIVDANDQIEQNIAGAMNSNLAFYKGMLEGGGVDETVPESDMMADIWSQEPQIRDDTINWLMPYLTLAYTPLSDAELTGYVEFSESPAGQRLNSALVTSFDTLFIEISYQMGQAAAEYMKGQDI